MLKRNNKLIRWFCFGLTLCFSVEAPPLSSRSSFLAPYSAVPTTTSTNSTSEVSGDTEQIALSAFFTTFSPLPGEPVPIPSSTFTVSRYQDLWRKPLNQAKGEAQTIELLQQALLTNPPSGLGSHPLPSQNMYLFFLDLNNLRLRNWIYSHEMMDVVIQDLDHQIALIVSKVIKKVGTKKFKGFHYQKGGDERVIVLPTDDPNVVGQVIREIQTYLRRELPKKYKIAILQIDDDSRLRTEGLENPKDDRKRRTLIEGEHTFDGEIKDMGIKARLEKSGAVTALLSHAGQYHLVYEDEPALEEALLKIQAFYPGHDIHFKPHPYQQEQIDLFSASIVGTSLADTLKDMNSNGFVDLHSLLRDWVLRAEIGTQRLQSSGKDAAVLIQPHVLLLTQNRRRRVGSDAVLKNEDAIRAQARTFREVPPGRHDDRFYALRSLTSAIEDDLRHLNNPGYLVQVDLGYLSQRIKKRVAQFEERFRKKRQQQGFSTHGEDFARALSHVWWQKYRVSFPRLKGVNTKFLNEVYKHGGTDDIISALLASVWDSVQALNHSRQGNWLGHIRVFRSAPDRLYFWFPRSRKDPDKTEILKQQLTHILRSLRKSIKENTLDPLDLYFIISVLDLHEEPNTEPMDSPFPNGDAKKAWALIDNMLRTHAVFTEHVLKESPTLLENGWEGWEGTDMRTKLEQGLAQRLREISPQGRVMLGSLTKGNFFNPCSFYIFHHAGFEALSDVIKIDLATRSMEEASHRFVTEKCDKWSQQIAIPVFSEITPNFDELLYILSSLLEKRQELEKFRKLNSRERQPLSEEAIRALFEKIQKERQATNQAVFELTGLYFDAQQGVFIPKEVGASKVGQVLKDPDLKNRWKALRQSQRHWLQFRRHASTFEKNVHIYEKFLHWVPRLEKLIKDLKKTNPRLYSLLAALFSPEARVVFSQSKGPILISFVESDTKYTVVLNSISPDQFLALKKVLSPVFTAPSGFLILDSGLSWLEQALDTAI